MQVQRTKALAQYIPEPKDRLRIAEWRKLNIIPIVLTLSNTPVKIFEGVPIIPVFYNSFFNDIQRHIDELMVLSKLKPVKLSRLAKI